MRNLLIKSSFFGVLFFFGTSVIAGRTYENEDARFKITFPGAFDAEVEEKDGMIVVSLSASFNDMILLVSAFVYEEVIPEDEYALKVAEGVIITADAFNSKFKEKKCVHWDGGGNNPGLVNPIKGKIPDGAGGKYTFFGNIYITMAYGIEYRITALSTSKKGFDTSIETAFINSFRLL
jgi:hypothetical protein